MSDTPHISEVIPFPTLDDIDWSGKVVHFTKDRYQAIPQSVKASELYGTIRNRYTTFGLIDNVVLSASRLSAFWLGQWMIGCVFCDEFPSYSIVADEERGSIREIRVDLPKTWNLKDALTEFIWNPKNAKKFLSEFSLRNDAIMSFHVTNSTDEWFTIEQFHERDVLAFSGGIRGIVRAAEFTLDFGANEEELNYDVLYHIAEPPFIATEDSCELRIEGSWIWEEDGPPKESDS
ncbi:MAG: hypothetical protein J5I65_17785 [Aridibacter famidurans]|nr:hypothetical protein [Aridibacter famidurans]